VEARNEITSIERRSKTRFPVQLKVRFRTVGHTVINGIGQTVNISSRGLLIAALQDMRAGLRLKMNMEWPFLLNGEVPMQLIMIGKVVRSLRSTFAVSFIEYQFRTCRAC
jgi:hypothetical protein